MGRCCGEDTREPVSSNIANNGDQIKVAPADLLARLIAVTDKLAMLAAANKENSND